MMGKPRPPEKAVLFVSSLYSMESAYETSKDSLKKTFGTVLFESQPIPWQFSNHYNDELGTPIYRSLLFFDAVIEPSFIIEAKHITNDLESELSRENRRLVNLDPGYMTLAKVVLASTKNYSHRIYLGRRIYGELALYFKDGMFRPAFYTYNDYKSEPLLSIFCDVRLLLKKTFKG